MKIGEKIEEMLREATSDNPISRTEMEATLVNLFPSKGQDKVRKAISDAITWFLPERGIYPHFNEYGHWIDENRLPDPVFRSDENGHYCAFGVDAKILPLTKCSVRRKNGDVQERHVYFVTDDLSRKGFVWGSFEPGYFPVPKKKHQGKGSKGPDDPGDVGVGKKVKVYDSLGSAQLLKSEVEKVPKYDEDSSSGSDLETRVSHLEMVTCAIKDESSAVLADYTMLANRVKHLEESAQLASKAFKLVKVKKYDGTVIKLKDVVFPPFFDEMKDQAEMRKPTLLVGPAGCGKTHSAELLAKVLGLKFYGQSFSSGVPESAITGRSNPNIQTGESVFETTDFIEAYERGGLYLMDEVDAADPNVLLILNQALGNRRLTLNKRTSKRYARQHSDFVIVATANTYGRGASRIYAGRNQLDGASIDRFRIGMITCYYDHAIETALCPDDEIRQALWTIRDKMEAAVVQQVVSTRFIKDAYEMKAGKDWKLERILSKCFEGWRKEEIEKVGYDPKTLQRRAG